MRIRGSHSRTGLATDTVEREIIGGSADNSTINFGYIQTDDGIRAMPSPAISSPAVRLYSPYRVECLNQPGFTVYVNVYGQFYVMTPGETDYKSVYVNQLPMGQFYTGFMYYKNSYTMALGAAETVMLIKNRVKYMTYTLPRYLKCGCFHCGRLFGRDTTEPYTVRWSGLEINDWADSPDGSGYIVLDLRYGEIVNMYELGDKVIILRQHGITVLRALGDTRNFSVDAVMGYELSVPIENPYAVVCRGKLFFSTDECIYSFDGVNLERIVPQRKEKLSNFANPQCYENRYVYFECLTDKSSDGYILEYDLDTGRTGLFCKSGKAFWRDMYGIHYFKDNQMYSTMYGNDADGYLWQSEEYDLGSDAVKTLKGICTEGEGNPKITVTADGVSRTFEGTGAKRVMLRGRKFAFKVSGNADIRRLSATWEVSK